MHIEFDKKPLTLGLVLAALAAAGLGSRAGDLQPPGPPSPTMKTLLAIEPRQIIWAGSLNPTERWVIDEPGSYYFGEDIDATGKWGIEVAVSDVTIDLNGFSLRNGFGTGIRTDPGSSTITNVTVRNGTVSGWDSHGIALDSTDGEFNVSDVFSSDNGAIGILVASGQVVDCVAHANDSDGIVTLGNSIVTGCIAFNNSHNGIQVGQSSIVSGCVTADNTANGIRLSGHGTAEGNVCTNNKQAGIRALNGENRVEANHVTFNQWGIQAAGTNNNANVVICNSAVSNSTVNYDVHSSSDLGPIGQAATTTSAWANFED